MLDSISALDGSYPDSRTRCLFGDGSEESVGNISSTKEFESAEMTYLKREIPLKFINWKREFIL